MLRQMPNHRARSHPTNVVLVHTHPLVKEGFGADVYSDLRSALGVSDQKLADSLSIPMRTLQRRLERGRFIRMSPTGLRDSHVSTSALEKCSSLLIRRVSGCKRPTRALGLPYPSNSVQLIRVVSR
jgi:hypothetical protein